MNLKKTILDQYQIDIDEINLIKLYKIEEPDISSDELEKKLAAARKKWVQGANSPNEKFAARDKARLAQADIFEEILRNKKYLKALFEYHKKGGEDNSASDFAREFFTSLKGVNKSVSQKDFNFFMQYFQEQRKNEKAILEMLKKEFRAVILKGAAAEEEEESKADDKKSRAIAQTRFHKDSICMLHKIELKYQEMQKSPFLMKKYPELSQSMYEFSKIGTKDPTEFIMYIDGAIQDAFTVRKNDSANNAEYIPISDFYNTWKDLMKRPDVTGNFYAFKKLVQYPKLTPYLYLAENVDIPFLEMLLKMIRDEYSFGGLDDFLFVYFKPLAEGRHYSFTLDKKLENKLKKIEQNPEAAEQDANRRSSAAKRRKMIPLPLQALRFMATWPVCLVQFLFESFRFMVVNVQKLSWVLFLFFTVLYARIFSNGDGSILELLFALMGNFRESVAEVVYGVVGTYDFHILTFIIGAAFTLIKFAVTFGAVPALLTQFLYVFARRLDRSVDLMGYHKTFQNIQQSIEQQLLYHYKKLGKRLYKKLIWPIAANILTPIAVVVLVSLAIPLINFLVSNISLAAFI